MNARQTYLFSWYADATYWNTANTDYYFGVTASESTAERVACSAPDSLKCRAGVNGIKQLNQQFALLMNIGYMAEDRAVQASPRVSRSDQWSAYGGLLYQF